MFDTINEITFIRWKLSPFEMKLAREFKRQGIKISTVTIYEPREEYKQFSDESIYWLKSDEKNVGIFKKLIRFFILLKKVLKKKYSIVIGITSNGNYFPALFFFLLRKKAKKRIYFPYDIAYFRYKDYKTYPWYNRWSEKYNFRCCDGIAHKGPKDELKYLPKEFRAMEKPSIQFLPYCNEDAIVEMDKEFFDRKLSKKDGRIHLVYVGGVYHDNPGQLNTIDVFRKIVNQKLVLHIYARNFEDLKNISDYKELEQTGYLILHKPIYSLDFQKEISKYDWGVFIFYFNYNKISKNWAKTSFGNKISSYLEAGIPIIVNEDQIFASNFILENNYGISIDNSSEIKNKIENTNYANLITNIKIRRDEFTINKNMVRVIDFINSK